MKNKILILVAGVALLVTSCEKANSPEISSSPSTRLPRLDPKVAPLKRSFALPKGGDVMWQRHILQESYGDKILLLVIDEPIQEGLRQKVVFRQSFAARDHQQMQQMVEKYSLHDLAQPAVNDVMIKTDNPLWPITREWTIEEEALYNSWIQEHSNPDFITGSGVFVDCADYAMTLRWIYAHERGLPAANTLGGSNKLFGSWESTRAWDRLPSSENWRDDERFKAALMYLLDNAFTQTIINDLYPLKLEMPFVGPGAVYLTLWGSSGHTRTIIHVGESTECYNSRCIVVVYGNEPSRDEAFVTEEFPYQQTEGNGGLMRFRWPIKNGQTWRLAASRSMPGYSREQFQMEAFDFITTLSMNLELWRTPLERAVGLVSAFRESLNIRLAVTAKAYFYCHLTPCTPGTPLYDELSTPSRDHRLKTNIQFIRNAMSEVDANNPEWKSYLRDLEDSNFRNYGMPWTYYDLLTIVDFEKFTSDPRDDFFVRWGIADLADKAKLKSLGRLVTNQLNERQRMVEVGQYLCPAFTACDMDDPQIKASDTTEMDAVLRKFQADFLTKLESLEPRDQWGVVAGLNQTLDYVYACGDHYSEECTVSHMLIAEPEHFATMSPRPYDSYKLRWGVPR